MPLPHLRLPRGARSRAPRAAALLAALLALSAASAHAQLRAAPAIPPLAGPAAPDAPSDDAGLLIPVAGVEPSDLRDTFHAGRSGGREHQAIDIHAPEGTPVLAAADGTILKLHRGDRGGTALSQLGEDGRTRYYYAHLARYAEGIAEGRRVRRGDTIGYVGDTGNVAPGDFHLHFSVAVLPDSRRWWEGAALNPYLLLRAAARRPFGLAPLSTAAPATVR